MGKSWTYSSGWVTPASRTLWTLTRRGDNGKIDAARNAKYAYRYYDKADHYAILEVALVFMKNLLSDREFLLPDRKRYQVQLSDQKKYMVPADYKHKGTRWKKVIKTDDE